MYLIYRENVLRYFQPFDHKGPIYTYFIFLPIYLLAWTVFFIPTLFDIKARWKNLSANSKWMIWAVLLIFLFFTLSGSRRNYYVLPFAILMTADWIADDAKRMLWAGRLAIVSFVAFVLHFNVLQPLYYSRGITVFAEKLETQANKIRPWSEWNVVLLDPESKVSFYLQLPPQTKTYGVQGLREHQTQQSLQAAWPVLQNADKKVIFVTRKRYESDLIPILKNYSLMESTPNLGERVLGMTNLNDPIAFIPPQSP